ncbi:hypothetical protein [Salininema proteolyticum]|uniref:Integral membrane protein n=1 Tax=Salininema proteolyticum TaxID=1607685 RepID=A0ABV8TZV3_9ACTN
MNNISSTRREGGAAATAAAILYCVWGVLHLGLGAVMAASGLDPRGELEAESLMFFLCAIVFGAQAIAVGLVLNRRNDLFGYWLNLVVLGAIDIAFLLVLVRPGHVDLAGGLSGPVVWAAAAVLSTIALRNGRRREVRPDRA